MLPANVAPAHHLLVITLYTDSALLALGAAAAIVQPENVRGPFVEFWSRHLDDLRLILVEVLADCISPADAKAACEFFESEAGQRWILATPALQVAGGAAGARLVADNMSELVQIIESQRYA